MSLEKRQILPLVKPIIAISVCIVIFSVTWMLQDQDNQEEAVVENSDVKIQDQTASTTTADTTNDSAKKDADKADNSESDGNSDLNALSQQVLSINGYNEENVDEGSSSDDDGNLDATDSVSVSTVTVEATPAVEVTPETDNEPKQVDNQETTNDDINSTLSTLTNNVSKTTSGNQQEADQLINTSIINNPLTDSLPVDTIELVPEENDGEQEKTSDTSTDTDSDNSTAPLPQVETNQQDTSQQNSTTAVSNQLTSPMPIGMKSESETISEQEKIGNEKTNANASSHSTLSTLANAVQLAADSSQQKNDSNPDSNSALSTLADAAQLVTGSNQQKNNSNSDDNAPLSALAGAAQLVTAATQQKNDPNADSNVALSALAGALELATRSSQTSNNKTQKSEGSLSSSTTVDALVSEESATQILSSVKEARPDLPINNLRYSNIEGVYKATLQDSTVFFSGDGQFFIIGDMYQVKDKQLINLQEEKRRQEEAAFAPQRAKMLDAIPLENMVIFPSIVSPKAYIHVFTDIDCGFCRKLHRQIPKLQAQGVEVRYLAFPRAGVDSVSAQKLATIWCADNPRKAMTLFKQENKLDIALCEPNPVSDHYKLGQDIGILGTPSIVLSSGQVVSGAPSAEQLIDIMKEANLY